MKGDRARVLGSVGARRWALALGAAAALGAAFSPLSVWPLALFALAPWLAVVSRAPFPIVVLGSFAVGTTYGLATAPWLPGALHRLGASWGEAALGFLVVAAFAKGVPLMVIGLVARATRSGGLLVRALAVGAAFFIVESLVSAWPLGVPWGLLGHSQLGVPGVAQVAVVGGVPLVSALLGAISQAGATAASEGGSARSVRILAPLLAAWVVLALLGFPLARAMRPATTFDEHREISLLLVQPNLPHDERWAPDRQIIHVKRLVAQTEVALGGLPTPPDLVLWPENLVTTPIETEPELEVALLAGVARLGMPVVLGAARQAHGSMSRRYRSSVLWLSPTGETLAAIDKVRAIPVLESSREIPGARLLSRLFGEAARWPRVEEAEREGPLRGPFPIAAVLCYEALFPGIVRERRSPDTVAIVNLADDSWAESRWASEQLFSFAAFRAIEQRLTLVRVAHGGLSGAVDAFGRTIETLPRDETADAIVAVGPSAFPTLREKLTLAGLPLGAALGVGWLVRPRRPRVDQPDAEQEKT